MVNENNGKIIFNRKKIETFVDFPFTLSMEKYVINEDCKSSLFDLYAVIVLFFFRLLFLFILLIYLFWIILFLLIFILF